MQAWDGALCRKSARAVSFHAQLHRDELAVQPLARRPPQGMMPRRRAKQPERAIAMRLPRVLNGRQGPATRMRMIMAEHPAPFPPGVPLGAQQQRGVDLEPGRRIGGDIGGRQQFPHLSLLSDQQAAYLPIRAGGGSGDYLREQRP